MAADALHVPCPMPNGFKSADHVILLVMMMVKLQGHSGGRRGSKGSKLTPLEDFVQSNMPLQGRSLFKKISLEPESMVSPP